MSLPLIALGVLAFLGLGYRFYGRFVAAQFALDDEAPTPAITRGDGVDFVPTRPSYLLGQHFSAIAAAGPSRDRSWPASSSGGFRACSGSAWEACSSGPSTTSPA